ncbi:YdgA family protein [Advenella sp. RU8]|uniref:YdgA family protein n=1 Tax=Advenella sp. RU8 TaxID=3399575 RepID=UPI003AAF7D21
MKTTNIVIGVLVAAGAVWGGSTWYIGQQSKGQIDQSIRNVNDFLAQASPYIRLSEVSYEKGFLSSTGIYKLNIDIPDLPEELANITFLNKVYHGPLPLIQEGRFTPALAISKTTLINNDNTKKLFEAANGQEPFTSSSILSFAKEIENTIKTATLKFVDTNGEITVEPMQALTHTNLDYAFINTEATGGAIKAKGKSTASLSVDGFQLSNKTTRTANKNYVGDSALKFGKFNIVDPAQTILIDNIDMTARTTESPNGLLNGDVTYSVNKINVNKIDFGTTSMKMLFNNVDMKAVNDFSRATANLNLASASPEEEAALDKEFENLFFKLADAKFEFHIDPLNIKGTTGEALLNFGVVFNGEKASSASRNSIELFATQALRKANLSFSIDDNLIKEFGSGIMQVTEGADKATADAEAQVISGMAGMIAEQSGMAIYKDGKTTSSVSYDADQPEGSQIDFNGKKMGLNEFAMTASSLLGLTGSSAAPALLNEEELFQALENDTVEEPAEQMNEPVEEAKQQKAE